MLVYQRVYQLYRLLTYRIPASKNLHTWLREWFPAAARCRCKWRRQRFGRCANSAFQLEDEDEISHIVYSIILY